MTYSELKISVLMSVCNGERFVKEAIESIFNQALTDFEFIIIDDASSDKTPEILQSYANYDSRIIIVKNDCNLGLTKSLNKGLSKCKGKYIARIDADDIAVKSRLQKQYSYMERHPETSFLCGDVIIIGEKGRKQKEVKINPQRLPIEKYLLFHGPLIHSTMFFRNKIITELGGYDENYRTRQDLELWLRAIRNGYQFDIIHENLIYLRYHANSLSYSKIENFYLSLSLRLMHLGYKYGLDIELDEAFQIIKNSFISRHFTQKIQTRKIAKFGLQKFYRGSYFTAIIDLIHVFIRMPFWISFSQKTVLMNLLRRYASNKGVSIDIEWQ